MLQLFNISITEQIRCRRPFWRGIWKSTGQTIKSWRRFGRHIGTCWPIRRLSSCRKNSFLSRRFVKASWITSSRKEIPNFWWARSRRVHTIRWPNRTCIAWSRSRSSTTRPRCTWIRRSCKPFKMENCDNTLTSSLTPPINKQIFMGNHELILLRIYQFKRILSKKQLTTGRSVRWSRWIKWTDWITAFIWAISVFQRQIKQKPIIHAALWFMKNRRISHLLTKINREFKTVIADST